MNEALADAEKELIFCLLNTIYVVLKQATRATRSHRVTLLNV